MARNPNSRGKPFAAGNPGGPGNPFASAVQGLRAEIYKAVTREELAAIVKKLIALAKGGDLEAAQMILDRTLGKVKTDDITLDIGGSPYKILIGVEAEKIA